MTSPTPAQVRPMHHSRRQVSPRGGELFCSLNGDRVELAGYGALFLKGQIRI